MSGDARLDKVLAARRRYDERVASIRNDRSLSAEGRRRAIAREYVAAADAINGLRAEALGDRDRTRKALEAKLLRPAPLGMGAGASERIARDASFRDALERAERAESSDDLLRLLHRAQRSDDVLQERACLAVAFDRNDIRVIDAHIEAHPAERNDVKELARSTGRNSGVERLEIDLSYKKPVVPTELSIENDTGIRRLATTDDGAATA